MDFETHPMGTATKLQQAFEREQDSSATIDALVGERAVLLTALHEIKGMHHWQADRPLMAIVRKAIERVTPPPLLTRHAGATPLFTLKAGEPMPVVKILAEETGLTD